MQSHDDSSTRAGTVRSKAITRNDDHHQVVTLPVYSQSAPAEAPESRLSSAGMLLLAVGFAAGLGGLAAYAMGCSPPGKKAAKKRRAVSSLDLGLEGQLHAETHEEELLERAAVPAGQVTTTVWAPLPEYQIAAAPAPALPMSTAATYAAEPMMAAPVYAAAAPVAAYAMPAPPVYAAAPAPVYATPPAAVYAAAPAPVYDTPPAPAYYARPPVDGAPFEEPMVMPSEPLPRVSY